MAFRGAFVELGLTLALRYHDRVSIFLPWLCQWTPNKQWRAGSSPALPFAGPPEDIWTFRGPQQ